MKETELYPPVKGYLESQGYTVKGEINDCDVAAVRANEPPVIVELKNTITLGVLLQAVQRIAISDIVYVAVPRDCPPLKTQYKAILKLFRMLGLGLIAVHIQSRPAIVETLLDPGAYHPRRSQTKTKRLLKEFDQRVGDPNPGGATRRGGLMTAYRQKAIRIASYLRQNGPTKASAAAEAVSEPKTRDILYRNVYGWFERVATGIYTLSPRGRKETPRWLDSSAAANWKQPRSRKKKHKKQ